MQLIPWSFRVPEGFTLRGLHTPPRGKPLLHFLHGNGFCSLVYAPMLERLSLDFDLWLSDAQGHGDSDHGGPFVGWNRSAELAVAALQQHLPLFGGVPRYAVGHSFGGAVTALALARHPALFDRAVLLDPMLFSRRTLWLVQLLGWTGILRSTGLAAKARKRRLHWDDIEAARRTLRDRGIFRNWTEEALDAFVRHALKAAPQGGVELKCRPEREADIFSSVPRGLWPALAQVRTPTLVLQAEVPPPPVGRSVQSWAARQESVQVCRMAGGHCFMQEFPVDAAAAVAGWLRAGVLPAA